MNQPIPPLIHQMFLTKAGLFCSERLSIDIIYLNQCIDLLLPTFKNKEKELIKEYEDIFGKDSWVRIIKKRTKLVKKIAETKMFYDVIQDKNLLKKKSSSDSFVDFFQKIFKKFFYRSASRIFLMEKDIYDLFVFLVSRSDIQRHPIKTEYFKNLEQRENRNIKFSRDKPTGGN